MSRTRTETTRRDYFTLCECVCVWMEAQLFLVVANKHWQLQGGQRHGTATHTFSFALNRHQKHGWWQQTHRAVEIRWVEMCRRKIFFVIHTHRQKHKAPFFKANVATFVSVCILPSSSRRALLPNSPVFRSWTVPGLGRGARVLSFNIILYILRRKSDTILRFCVFYRPWFGRFRRRR